MKRYASPGIDSPASEQGIFNSGAGFGPTDESPDYVEGEPFDWSSANPVCGLETGRLIGTSAETQAPPAKSLRIRRRGISPWGGFAALVTPRYNGPHADSQLNVGGSVDHNAGANSLIAGGPGTASSFVRVHGKEKTDRGMKLPNIPQAIRRGGAVPVPTGGTFDIAAPLTPASYGFPSIVKISDREDGSC